MDDARAVEELIVLGRGEAEKAAHQAAVRALFLDGPP
jgi:hypothetical protein